MSSKNSHTIARNSLHLYLRMLLNLGISLYTARVVLNVLGVEDFGLFNVVGGFIAMFSFLNNSMAGATQRFLTFEIGRKDERNLKRVFNVSSSIHLVIAFLLLILAETIGIWFIYNKLTIPADRLNAALWVYHAAVFTAVLNVLNVPYVAVVIARERMSIFAYLSILETILKLLIVFLLLLFSFDKLKLYAVLTSSITVIIFCFYRIICRRQFKETLTAKLVWDKGMFREMAGFAVWVMNGNLAVVGYTQGLNILLNMFFGPAVNAARGIAVQVQNAVMGFASSFQTSMNPQITKSYANKDFDFMHKLIFTSSKVAFFLLFMISLPIMLETNFILTIWLKIVPEHTDSFVRLTILTGLVATLSNPMIVSVHATGRLKRFQLWEGSVLLIIVPVSYLFLKKGYPPESVFFVHLVISIVVQFMRVWLIAPMINMNKQEYFNKVVLKIMYVAPLCFVTSFAAYTYLDVGWLRLVLLGVLSVFSMSLLTYMLGLDNLERIFVKNYIYKILNRDSIS